MNQQRGRSLSEIFRIPVAIFALTLFGLVAALLTEGTVDIIGVAGVASALLVTAWIFLKPEPDV